jgi:PAS domain S-box-containing protein
MNKAIDVINNLMLDHGMKRKRDVARYFGVSPQALSLWIAKNHIPPKHLLKIKDQNSMEKTRNHLTKNIYKSSEEKEELDAVVNYLMKENLRLKEELKSLKENQLFERNNTGTVFDKIIAETLYLSGKVSDGVILETHGDWEKLMGYEQEQLIGMSYDKNDLIHPDDLKAAKKIQQKLKQSESITSSKYSTIQRWKNKKTGQYILLSMVWDINVQKDHALIVSKPIDSIVQE